MSRRKMRLSSEERVDYVEKCLRNEISITQAADEAGVDRTTVKRGIMLYENEGPTGLLAARKNRHYPKELKLAAVTDYLAGRGSLREIAKNTVYGIRYS